MFLITQRLLTQTIQNMLKGKYRISQYHPRAHISHHISYPAAHARLITMDWALSAGCFIFLKRAVIKTLAGIVKQLLALRTQFTCT